MNRRVWESLVDRSDGGDGRANDLNRYHRGGCWRRGDESSGRAREGVPGRSFCEDIASMSMERLSPARSGEPEVRVRATAPVQRFRHGLGLAILDFNSMPVWYLRPVRLGGGCIDWHVRNWLRDGGTSIELHPNILVDAVNDILRNVFRWQSDIGNLLGRRRCEGIVFQPNG